MEHLLPFSLEAKHKFMEPPEGHGGEGGRTSTSRKKCNNNAATMMYNYLLHGLKFMIFWVVKFAHQPVDV